jgi:hypothetical protein
MALAVRLREDYDARQAPARAGRPRHPCRRREKTCGKRHCDSCVFAMTTFMRKLTLICNLPVMNPPSV